MADYFRVKIVSKRQVTLPHLMLHDLHLAEGDELEFEVEGGRIRAVQALKVVPAEYFPSDVLEMIRRRRLEMAAGVDDGEATPEPSGLAEEGPPPAEPAVLDDSPEPWKVVAEALKADPFAAGKVAKVARRQSAIASSE